jgi:hypothetical protein
MTIDTKKKSKLIRPDQNNLNLANNQKHSNMTKSPTPSPNHSSSKTKVLTTNFHKPCFSGVVANNVSSTLVANAESTLNSIMNSLNQIDYSHLGSPVKTADIYSRDRLNHVGSDNGNLGIVSELKEENNLMQAMIERLMEENAQLRAEKMITSSKNPATTITNNISQNINNLFYTESERVQSEEVDLYSTVRNKKFNQLRDSFNSNVHNLNLNSKITTEDQQNPKNGGSYSKKIYLKVDNNSSDSCSNTQLLESLKIIEETYENTTETKLHSPSKAS